MKRGGRREKKKSVAMERHFSTDVLADIVQRLPPSARRRARLVCRHWRDVVDDRTTEMQSRTKPLFWDNQSSVAYVVDHLSSSSSAWRCRELWRRGGGGEDVQLVGTCNGLLLLCENNGWAGGALTVVNPVTGETLPLPELPCARTRWWGHKDWHLAYCFGYHPTSGKYKVVHVPCILEGECKFRTMHLLTLGEPAWREMPFSAPICFLYGGIVSINGTAYWISAAAKLVSFNLDNERVPCSNTPLARGGCYPYLTNVHGKLGFVVDGRDRTDVWVLDEGRRWILRYNLQYCVPRAHFTYAGECVLTVRDRSSIYMHRWRRTPVSSGLRLLRRDDVVRVVHREDKGTPVVVNDMMMPRGYFDDVVYRAFAYVETMEPLNVYA